MPSLIDEPRDGVNKNHKEGKHLFHQRKSLRQKTEKQIGTTEVWDGEGGYPTHKKICVSKKSGVCLRPFPTYEKNVKRVKSFFSVPSHYMTDHAGPRRCESHPETNFWHPPIEVIQFWRPFF